MWIVRDEAMRNLLGGDFVDVIEAMKDKPKISVCKLFKYQSKYKSRQGFNFFFNRYIEPIKHGIDYLDNSSIIGKFLGAFVRK